MLVDVENWVLKLIRDTIDECSSKPTSSWKNRPTVDSILFQINQELYKKEKTPFTYDILLDNPRIKSQLDYMAEWYKNYLRLEYLKRGGIESINNEIKEITQNSQYCISYGIEVIAQQKYDLHDFSGVLEDKKNESIEPSNF